MELDAYTKNIIMTSNKFDEERRYWINKLSGIEMISSFPADFNFAGVSQCKRNYISHNLSSRLSEKIMAMCNHSPLGIYIMLLTGVNYLIYKYSGVDDIVVGMPAFLQTQDEGRCIGDMSAIRTILKDHYTYMEFLLDVKTSVSEASKYKNVPFEKVVELLRLNIPGSPKSFFNIITLMENLHDYNSAEDSEAGIIFSFRISGESVGVCINYDANSFSEKTIERILNHFSNFFEIVLEKPDIHISDIDILSPEERKQLLENFNLTTEAFPGEKTINELFEEQVERTPDIDALRFEGKRFTYRQLNEKANQIARLLRENGVGPDSIVGIMTKRSFEMVIGIMGILKAGGAYLPIDPDYPKERIKYILEDSSASTLLVQKESVGKIDFDINVFDLESSELYTTYGSNLNRINKPEHLAYVIYTSGSTGKPKGVMIEHRSLVNRLYWMQKKYPIGQGDVILQKTPYTFDVSVWELLWWSLQGASVCMLTPGGEKNPEKIVEAIEENKVTTMHFVPSMLNLFLEYLEIRERTDGLKCLKQVFASGEALSLNQVKRFNKMLYEKYGTKLHNLYGPTEAAIDVSYFDCSPDDELKTIPIGKPIDNINLYVLDKNNMLQPIGVPGELHISGVGLARGYLNRPDLTSEKFTSNPFIEGERMYKTGDLARWMPDGNIEYLGRIDHQVKVRGYRIELGEIEKRLLSHELVKETVVVANEDKQGNKYICTYIVSEKEFAVHEIREFLRVELPDYMVPSYFVRLDKLPLTRNGKLDRKALPKPETNIRTGVEYVAPSNETEKKLVDLWKEVLSLDTIGVNDNFFDIGGNSIRLVDLFLKLEERYPGRLKVADLFSFSTVSKLASFLDNKDNARENKIEFRMLSLPPEYFIDEYEKNEDAVLEFELENNVCRAIKNVSEEQKIVTFHLFLAAFIYLLADVTEKNEMSIYTLDMDGKGLLPIHTDLEGVNDLYELFKLVSANYRESEEEGGFSIKRIGKELVQKGVYEIIPLFCKNSVPENIPLKIFDFILCVDDRNDSIRLVCEYNAQRLSKEKVKLLVYAYVKLLNLITNND